MFDFLHTDRALRLRDFGSRLLAMKGFHDPVIRKRLFYAAMLLFCGGIFVSLRHHPVPLSALRLLPLALVIPLILITFSAAALEFRLMAALYGQRLSWLHALETVILGTAANLLPLPGNAMFKISRLKSVGVGYGHGVAATLLMAALGLCLVCLLACICFLALGAPLLSGLSGAAGFCLSVFTFFAFRRINRDALLFGKLAVIRALQILLLAGRLYLCLLALGLSGTFAQAAILTVANTLGSFIAFVPAGLGVQEVFAAAIGPLIGIGAASAFLISSLNRIVSMTVVFILSGILALHTKHKGEPL